MAAGVVCVAAGGVTTAIALNRSDGRAAAQTSVETPGVTPTTGTRASGTPTRPTTANTTTGPTTPHTAPSPSTPLPPADPSRIRLVSAAGKLLVDAPVRATKLDSKGVLAPPAGISGWYAEKGWPRPGQNGAAIIAGHISSHGSPDTFAQLIDARPGDQITVDYPSGKSVRFVVTKSAKESKTAVPKDTTIWDYAAKRPLLRLITCDPTTPLSGGHYLGNWVVWADLA